MSDLQVFLSHSHLDNAFCQRLVAAIAQQEPEADVFFDLDSLIGGDTWMSRIQQELLARPLFVVVLSLASVGAEWVREEVNMALRLAITDSRRRVIPVLHQECDANQLAPLLRNRQQIDCATQDERFGFTQVIAALRSPTMADMVILNPAFEDARRRAAEIHDLFAAGQWREVVRLGRFASTLPGNERDAELWGELGIALVRCGQAQEGVVALHHAVGINRFRVDLWRERARTELYQLRQPEAAMTSWDMALAATVTPQGRFDLFIEECEGLNALGRWQDALKLNIEAESIHSQVPRLWVCRGDSLLGLQQPMEATHAYDYALALDPHHVSAWKGKSFALVQMGAYQGALELCDQYLAIQPTDSAVWSMKAKACMGVGKLSDAQQAIDRAISLEPQNVLFLGEKAQYLIQAGQFGVALQLLEHATDLAPDAAYLWSLKALAYRGLRRFDEARAAELVARDLQP